MIYLFSRNVSPCSWITFKQNHICRKNQYEHKERERTHLLPLQLHLHLTPNAIHLFQHPEIHGLQIPAQKKPWFCQKDCRHPLLLTHNGRFAHPGVRTLPSILSQNAKKLRILGFRVLEPERKRSVDQSRSGGHERNRGCSPGRAMGMEHCPGVAHLTLSRRSP